MDRLTEYICGAAHGKRGRTIEEAGKSKDFCRGEFEATGCIDKLAQYEDTGLSPDEIQTLKRRYLKICRKHNCPFLRTFSHGQGCICALEGKQ
jgi:hypothetical protein